MARSVGEAAAQAIESGFRLAVDVNDRRRAQLRQDRMDEEAADERRQQRRRQQRADKTAALAAQDALIRSEGAALAAGQPDEAAMADFTAREGRLRQAQQQHLGEISGVDLEAETRMGADDIKALQAGDLTKLTPGQFSRAITVATGRPPADYLRRDGAPAPVEQAAQEFQQAMGANDQDAIVASLNKLLVPELRKGVGSPSRHGGKIVGKQIAYVTPDPRAPDERVIPVIRVYVDQGKNFRGPRPDGAPEGASGYYDAPLTERRSSDPDDPVKSIGIAEAMDYIGQHMSLVELLDKPEARAQLDLDAKSTFNPQQYLAALMRAGVPPTPKTTTKDTPIPRGGSVLRTTYDAQGKPIEERRIEGNPPAAPAGRPGSLQQTLDAIDGLVDDGTLTPEEGDARKKAAVARTTTGTRAQGLAAGGGRKNGERAMNDKEIGRRLQYVKEQRLALDKKRDVIMAEYKADARDASKTEAAALKAEMRDRIAKLDEEDANLRRNMETLEKQLELDDGDQPKLAAKGTGKLTKDAAAKRFGF